MVVSSTAEPKRSGRPPLFSSSSAKKFCWAAGRRRSRSVSLGWRRVKAHAERPASWVARSGAPSSAARTEGAPGASQRGGGWIFFHPDFGTSASSVTLRCSTKRRRPQIPARARWRIGKLTRVFGENCGSAGILRPTQSARGVDLVSIGRFLPFARRTKVPKKRTLSVRWSRDCSR